MKKISKETAFSIRFDRRLRLPVEDREYEDEEIKQIAIRQKELMDEHEKLDKQLWKIFIKDCTV